MLKFQENIKKILCTNEILEDDITYMNSEMKEVSKELKILQKLLVFSKTKSYSNYHVIFVSRRKTMHPQMKI